MSRLDNVAEPSFIERNAQAVTDALIKQYERLAGKPLMPAQADRVFIDVIAYREMLIRNAIQESAKQNLVAFAKNVMLDYLGDFFGVTRLEGETDNQLRERIRLAPESFATTGSRQAYIYHARSVSSDIIDAQATRAGHGDIYIYLLTKSGNVPQQLLDDVRAYVSGDKRRPLSDSVSVFAGIAKNVSLRIAITPLASANKNTVLADARTKADAFAASLKTKLGKDIVPSQIIDALSGDGVWQVNVIEPAAAIIIAPHEWANIGHIDITLTTAQEG